MPDLTGYQRHPAHRLCSAIIGPTGYEYKALQRCAYVTLAIRASKDTKTPTIQPKSKTPSDQASDDFYQATDGRLASVVEAPALVIENTAPSSLPLSFELRAGFKDRLRDDESHHVRNEPYLPLSLNLSRRLGQAIWLTLGPRLRLRFDAPLTLGLTGRFDVGVGTGWQLSLTFSGYHPAHRWHTTFQLPQCFDDRLGIRFVAQFATQTRGCVIGSTSIPQSNACRGPSRSAGLLDLFS